MKVSVFGAGNVGANTVMRLAEGELANEVVMVDVVEGVPQGKSLDLAQSAPIYGYDAQMIGTQDPAAIKGSDIVVVTAGSPRKPGMTRDDLLSINTRIVQSITASIVEHAPNAIVIAVTNPLDVMTQLIWHKSGFDKSRVIGMAGVLDAARFRAFIAMELDVSIEDTHAFVLGGHGDTMVPLARYSTVAGIPLADLMPQERIDALIERTRNGGAEIVSYLKTGSAYYAPSAAVYDMVESIVKHKKRILPCSVYLDGEYGQQGVFAGVPVKLGRKGVEEIIQIKLTEAEQAEFNKSAEDVRSNVKRMFELLEAG